VQIIYKIIVNLGRDNGEFGKEEGEISLRNGKIWLGNIGNLAKMEDEIIFRFWVGGA